MSRRARFMWLDWPFLSFLQLPFETEVYYIQHILMLVIPFYLMHLGGEWNLVNPFTVNSTIMLDLLPLAQFRSPPWLCTWVFVVMCCALFHCIYHLLMLYFIYMCSIHHHHHQFLNREGRLGTADDFATSFLHFSCSPLPSGTCRTPGLSIPWCRLPTSSFINNYHWPNEVGVGLLPCTGRV